MMLDMTTNVRLLTEYAQRLRRLHNQVRPLLPAAEQDELLELAIGVGILALPEDSRDTLCQCGHRHDRHREDPIVCLDCWHTPGQPDSTHHEHCFQPGPGSINV